MLRRIRFIDPPVMSDGELELVEQTEDLLPDLLAVAMYSTRPAGRPAVDTVARQSGSAAVEPGLVHPGMSEDEILAMEVRTRAFLGRSPRGRQTADQGYAGVPACHFWMRLNHPQRLGLPGRIVGAMGLRIGDNREIRLYAGHVGYNVLPAARGHRFAERAVRLLLPLARAYGLNPLIITSNPDNTPSRRTLERLGAKLIDVVNIPRMHPFYTAGERQKCRYELAV